MDYKQLAQTILQKVGGKTNVAGLTHCATRLRFNLHDEKKADTDGLKKTKGVMGVVASGGQYQVIIGSRTSLLPPQINFALFAPEMEFTQNLGLTRRQA